MTRDENRNLRNFICAMRDCDECPLRTACDNNFNGITDSELIAIARELLRSGDITISVSANVCKERFPERLRVFKKYTGDVKYD